jgi:predicted dehydrogenase
LDWDLWLGPAPLHKYNPNRAIYHFRWFWDTSGGQMTNLGQHALDIVDWYLGGNWPLSVMSVGGRYSLRDNGETPDTQDVLIEFPGWTAVWSHREASKGQAPAAGLEFCGPKGTLAISRSGFVVTPDRKVPPENTVPQFTGAHPTGGPARTAESGPPEFWTEAVKDDSGDARDQFKRHSRDFLNCVKSRKQPVSDLESGHRVATICHLANISFRLRRPVRWDENKETIPGDAEAAKLLVRPYRAPWDGVLQNLLKG